MNDQPLSPDHGGPLRVIVPGYTGARWVKWVDHITVSDSESPNFYQQRDYKVLPPTVETTAQAGPYWDKMKSIECLPVNSIIATVLPHHSDGTALVVKGYAMGAGGDGGLIAAVQVSANGGATWEDARITYREGRWSWTLWECVLDVAEAKAKAEDRGERVVRFLCRAVDQQGNMQNAECPWNLRGVAFNAYGTGRWQW